MSTPVIEAARRRTFAIISHPDAGKTTLTEKFLLYGGAVQSAGAVKARGERLALAQGELGLCLLGQGGGQGLLGGLRAVAVEEQEAVRVLGLGQGTQREGAGGFGGFGSEGEVRLAGGALFIQRADELVQIGIAKVVAHGKEHTKDGGFSSAARGRSAVAE